MGVLSLLPFLLCAVGSIVAVREWRVLSSPVRLFAPLRAKDKREKKEIRTTLILSLSGTLGVGNITGVATALILGGAGSVFWMLLSCPFAVALKYAESSIATARGNGEGIPGVLKNALPRPIGGALSLLYILVFLLLSLVLGGALQGNAILENTLVYFKSDRAILSVFLTIGIAIALFGKVEKILKILSLTLPFATIVYIILCIIVLLANFSLIPALLRRVLTEAFQGIRPGIAGVVGTLSSYAVREGFSAGVLSNEAGAGTSAFAHETGAYSHRAGAIGALEVVFDTAILCTLSAMTFLVGSSTDGAADASEVIENAFSAVLGSVYVIPLLLSLSLFAISSNLCYAVYARRALSYARLERWSLPFNILFLFSFGIGGLYASTLLVTVSHYLLFALCILTALAIIASYYNKRANRS